MFDDYEDDQYTGIDLDDQDDMRNDYWTDEDAPEPGDTESDLEPDWEELEGLAEAERFMEAGLAIW